MDSTAKTEQKPPFIFAAIAGYLILRGLWRVFVPGGPYVMPPWHYVSMATDVLLLVLLVLIWPRVPAPYPGAPFYVRYGRALFTGAIISAVVMILIRFTGDNGWWTGHLMRGF